MTNEQENYIISGEEVMDALHTMGTRLALVEQKHRTTELLLRNVDQKLDHLIANQAGILPKKESTSTQDEKVREMIASLREDVALLKKAVGRTE